MLERKIDKVIREFYASSDKALFLTGARQVGKSYAIEKYARSNYKIFVECNFFKNPELVNLFKGVCNEKDLLSRLELYMQISFIPGDTFIFFDEIQIVPDILTWMKFLVQDGRYRYALSGSLLGIELSGVRSFPVGFLTEFRVYPLDFEEFVLALGVNKHILDDLRVCWEKKEPVDDFVHTQMMNLFHVYMIVGGMPAVVQKYIDTNDFMLVLQEQKGILSLYKHDIGQYNKGRQLQINEIFDLIPSELNSQNKRFIIKNLHDISRFSSVASDFLWLKDAEMAMPTYNVDSPVAPLKLSEKRNLFKFFQNDVGLLSCQYSGGVQLRMLQGDSNINFGAIYENMVASELRSHGYNLYYFTSKKQGEVDFLIENDSEVVPIEVKSGKYYERHNALKNILSNREYDIKQAYVLCNDNLKVVDNITYAPVYMVMFIDKTPHTSSLVYKPDLSGLI